MPEKAPHVDITNGLCAVAHEARDAAQFLTSPSPLESSVDRTIRETRLKIKCSFPALPWHPGLGICAACRTGYHNV